jgi:hypothetical protein
MEEKGGKKEEKEEENDFRIDRISQRYHAGGNQENHR